MSDKVWKKRERQVAKFFGCKRTPLSGQNSGHETSSDVLHPHLYVEQKHRKSHAIINLWDDTAKKAEKEGKIPVVTLTQKGRPGFWVLVKSSDLMSVSNIRGNVILEEV